MFPEYACIIIVTICMSEIPLDINITGELVNLLHFKARDTFDFVHLGPAHKTLILQSKEIMQFPVNLDSKRPSTSPKLPRYNGHRPWSEECCMQWTMMGVSYGCPWVSVSSGSLPHCGLSVDSQWWGTTPSTRGPIIGCWTSSLIITRAQFTVKDSFFMS